MVLVLCGKLIFFIIAAAATASGGDKIAPITNATGHEIPGITYLATTSMAIMVIKTIVTASIEIVLIFDLKSGNDIFVEAS